MRSLIALTLLAAGLLARPAAAQVPSAPWVDLGFSLPGTHGNPLLAASGDLTGGSVLALHLSHALEGQHCYLVVGTSAIFAPYKGGTLVPYPNLLLEYPTGATGTLQILSHFPAGVPAGVPLVLQFWINDPGAVAGRAGSNAVGALTP